VTVNADAPYRVDPRVSLRPEPFGALAYHYGNRRLVFLRSADMLRVVERLDEVGSVTDALDAAGIAEGRRDGFLAALEDLERAEVIHARR
jgi:putative mycofactocin binding protein MftB